jgi:uncharacterized protein YjeT (DUF2065 family)
MKDLFTALALILVIEGVLYALFPDAMKRMIAAIIDIPDVTLCRVGLVSAVVGVVLVWLLRG